MTFNKPLISVAHASLFLSSPTQLSVQTQTDMNVSQSGTMKHLSTPPSLGLAPFLIAIHLFFSRFINVTIKFQLKAINIQTIINNETPDCYTFYITVSVQVKDKHMPETFLVLFFGSDSSCWDLITCFRRFWQSVFVSFVSIIKVPFSITKPHIFICHSASNLTFI